MKNREQLRGKTTATSGEPYFVPGAPLPLAENAGTPQPQRSPLNFTLWNDWIDDVLISYGHTPVVGVRGMSSIAPAHFCAFPSWPATSPTSGPLGRTHIMKKGPTHRTRADPSWVCGNRGAALCGNDLSNGVIVRGQCIHLQKASNGMEQQPNSVGYKQHNSECCVLPRAPDVGNVADQRVADEIGKILLANLAELRCTAIEVG
jgi:hypothetical protein